MDTKAKKEKMIHVKYMVSMAIILVLIVLTFLYSDRMEILTIDAEHLLNVGVDIVGMCVCGVLLYSLVNDKPLNVQNRCMFRLIFVICLLFHLEAAAFLLDETPDTSMLAVAYNSALICTEPLLIYSMWAYVCEELDMDRRDVPMLEIACRAALAINPVLVLLNLKYHFLFDTKASGYLVNGEHILLSKIALFVIYLAIIYVVVVNKRHSNRTKWILMSFLIFQFIAHLMYIATDLISMVFLAYLLSVMLIYVNVFSRRGKKLLKQQLELDQQRTALMISQIQPHFLYNVLTTITYLCETDPEEAEETTILFSQYLRTNLDSLRRTEPVTFGVELGHIKTYIALEKKRFGDKIIEEIDCPETEFAVPALGLQPIVENSIKHGIRGKDTPGHLRVTSRKKDGGYEVVIEDDGVGFDMHAPKPDDGRSHVGMANVKSRLEQMCHATVEVTSSPGNGCRTVIFFPE